MGRISPSLHHRGDQPPPILRLGGCEETRGILLRDETIQVAALRVQIAQDDHADRGLRDDRLTMSAITQTLAIASVADEEIPGRLQIVARRGVRCQVQDAPEQRIGDRPSGVEPPERAEAD